MRSVSMSVLALAVGLGLGYGLTGAVNTSSGTASAAETLSQEDRQEILDLISGSLQHYDRKDAEAVGELFTDDALFVSNLSGSQIEATKPEFLARFRERFAFFDEQGIQSRHFGTNTLLEPQADGTVAGETVVAIVWRKTGEPSPQLVNVGINRDEYVRTASGWKIQRREGRIDGN